MDQVRSSLWVLQKKFLPGQSLVALLRAIAPTLGATTLAWSFENGLPFPLNRHFIFITIAVGVGSTALMTLPLPASLNVPYLEAKRAAKGIVTPKENQQNLSLVD